MTTHDTFTERYGAPAPWRRRVIWVTTGVVGLAFLVWLGWAAWAHTDPAASSDLVGWEVDGEHSVTVKVTVHLRDADVDARCLLRAYAADHAVVGELSFTPEYGAPQPVVEPVRTERRATSVQLVGCTAEGQPRPQ